jgi:hypothetical protein
MPTPIVNFEGLPNRNDAIPPDTNGDVGTNHYVQMVNNSFQIWDKSGNSLYGPVDNLTLWSGFGGLCETGTDTDPIVLYDPLADRWLLSQLVFPDPFNPSLSHQCFAISTTPDPTASYHRYDFLTAGPNQDLFGDYPHLGVWPDGYYMTVNQFTSGGTVYAGAGNYAFERAKMLTGDPTAQMIYFNLDNQLDGGMLPSDLDGAPPPPGSPNYFIEPFNGPAGALHQFNFHADWATPANSTFTGPITITVAPWSFSLCPQDPVCINQPAGPDTLHAVNDRFMHRLAYRNMGDHESLVVNNTANAGSGVAGIRWYEIRDPNGTPFAYQQGTYSPSPDDRWMASIAMDRVGNMALGYSVANAPNLYPSIRYAGRLASDPPGTMPQGEGSLIAGTGGQLFFDRWGDYTHLSVDPSDDCTFWYTNQYYSADSFFGWQTRIGSFKFPSCTSGPTHTPTPTVTGTPPTNTPTFTPSNTPTLTPTPCGNYAITQSSGAAIVPGTTAIGLRCNDCTTTITLPFTYNLYDQPFNSVIVSSNGNLRFTGSAGGDNTNTCLPSSALNNAILAYWDDLCTGGCVFDTCDTCDVFTSTSGAAPNRIFNVEWRACVFSGFGCAGFVNFEVRLYEMQSRFDIVYGQVAVGGSGATVGVQRGTGTGGNFTQFACNQSILQPGLLLAFTSSPCTTNTPTHTVTGTPPTSTPTFTPSNTRTTTPTPTLTPTRTFTRTNTPTPSPTFTPAPAYLIGHVTWQGRPAQPHTLQQLPVTLTLKLGATELNYPPTTTDQSGNFVVSVTGLMSGTWNWRVKGPKYLANAGTVALTGAATTSVEMGLMRGGDADSNNVVNSLDFTILRATFGLGIGQQGYDARADFTGDNVVNSLDFTLLRANFGQGGAPPVSPGNR